MPSAKEQVSKIIYEQPDDSSYDDLLRELAFARMVDAVYRTPMQGERSAIPR